MTNNLTILCVLYPDPEITKPIKYIRDSLPNLSHYPDGQTMPNPSAIDYTPGHLLGCVSEELGLRKFLNDLGHKLIVTSDKDLPNSEFDKYLPEADIVISQPFWPAYLTKERFAKAKKLKLVITAGIGSDHVDLNSAITNNITVAEVTYCNSISVAEHNVMMILSLVRDYLTQHEYSKNGKWNIADCVRRSYDLEGMNVGILGSGRIGLAVLRRLKPFDVKLHYHDKYRLDTKIETELNLIYHHNVESLVKISDVVSINCPLHAETVDLFNKDLIAKMKDGSYIVNTARGRICNTEAIKNALESGKLAGYAGDVWFPQPAPADHPWRTMPYNGMTPHTSGSSLSAQNRYASGVREILECYLNNKNIRNEYLIVQDGKLAGTGAKSYVNGDMTTK
jgi:formate dehydrogenase